MTTAEFRNAPPPFQEDRQKIAGRYRLDARIGSGRLGDIFSAADERYEAFGVAQHVAIQIVPEIVVRNNTLFNRMTAGYEALRAAAHPNIVKYRHFGRDGDVGYLVMELLDGASLRRLLDEMDTLPLDEAAPVIRGVGEALRMLHARDLVHGNLTAGNVVITDDLEVRLLDVVPLGAAEAIFRGATLSDSYGRHAAGDDVFALACLAYEMLAGKHPFNHGTPAGGGLADGEPCRIATLTDGEWDALRRALSFDREQRTPSIAEFMRDLGIKGTERLRAANERPAEYPDIIRPAAEEQPPVSRPAAPVQRIEPVEPVAVVDSTPSYDHRPPGAEPASDKTSPLRALILGALAAGLGAWVIYGQPQERFVDLFAYVDENLKPGSAAYNGVPASQPTLAEPPARSPDAERTTSTAVGAAEPLQPADQPAPVAPAEAGDATETGDEGATSAASEPASISITEPEPEPGETGLILAESIVSVAEGGGAARIVTRRTSSSATPLVWWTSEHTAGFDTDFVSVQGQLADDASSDVLHIPLVNDSVLEPGESFFVNFGLRNAEQGQIERIATVRVDIIDDDSR